MGDGELAGTHLRGIRGGRGGKIRGGDAELGEITPRVARDERASNSRPSQSWTAHLRGARDVRVGG